MSNFAGDFSSQYTSPGTLFATSTGVTTDSHLTGVSADLGPNVANVLSAILVVGGIAGTGTPGFTARIQESNDGSNSWTDVASGAFSAQTTTNTVQIIPIKPSKRYLRSTGTVQGTNPVAECTIIFLAPMTTGPVNTGGFNQTAAATVA